MKQYTLQDITALYRKCRNSVLVLIVLLLLAIVGFFIYRPSMFVLAALAILYHLFCNRKMEKKYIEIVSQANLQHTVCKKLNTTEINKKGGILTVASLRDADLLPLDERDQLQSLFCGISGNLDGMPTAVADVSLSECVPPSKKIQFTTGCWMSVTLPEDTGADWRLMHHGTVPAALRLAWAKNHPNMQEVELSEEDAQKFTVYRATDSAAPSGKVMTQIHLLNDYTPGEMAVSLQGKHLVVYLQGRVLARNVKLNQAPTEEALNFDPMPEISYVARLAKVITAQSASAIEQEVHSSEE